MGSPKHPYCQWTISVGLPANNHTSNGSLVQLLSSLGVSIAIYALRASANLLFMQITTETLSIRLRFEHLAPNDQILRRTSVKIGESLRNFGCQ